MVLPVPPKEYDIGDAPVLSGTFVDRESGALTNPTTVQVKVRPPSGVIATYTAVSTPAATNPSVGVYELQLPAVSLAGDWYYRFEGTGDLIDAGESRFIVRGSAFTTIGTPPTTSWVDPASLETEPRLKDVALPPGVTLLACCEAATKALYNRTGRRYRFRTRTVRINQGNACGCSYDECSSTEVHLDGPVDPDSIVVTIAGVPVSPTAYHLYDRRVLVRHDGGYWPVCAHLSTPPGSAWTVTYTSGQEPPADVVMACRELAIDVALQVSGKPSRLPARTSTVSRRGVSLNLQSAGRKTGIPFVDMVVEGDNPSGLTRRGSVTSPDSIRQSEV